MSDRQDLIDAKRDFDNAHLLLRRSFKTIRDLSQNSRVDNNKRTNIQYIERDMYMITNELMKLKQQLDSFTI